MRHARTHKLQFSGPTVYSYIVVTTGHSESLGSMTSPGRQRDQNLNTRMCVYSNLCVWANAEICFRKHLCKLP